MPVRPDDGAAMSLRFSPTAWAKLLYMRDYGGTEVGGFGISASDDLLLVEDLRLVEQVTSVAHVAFDDESVADFIDEQVDAGKRIEQCGRIWIHTHPGNCARPSSTDEETFDRVFGRSNWAIMFILARAGETYARLRFNVGPGAELEIPIDIDYTRSFSACDEDGWEQEYLDNVTPQQQFHVNSHSQSPGAMSSFNGELHDDELLDDWREIWRDYTDNDTSAEELEA